MQAKYILNSLVSFFVGIATVILGLRVLFRLFDANPAAGFVDWIYSTSETLMAPFRGIFPPATLEGGIVLDVSALFAIIMYLVFGAVVMAAISMLPEPGPVERPAAFRRVKRVKK
jgi:uncharacterized protein YggT (Ycf19 family)